MLLQVLAAYCQMCASAPSGEHCYDRCLLPTAQLIGASALFGSSGLEKQHHRGSTCNQLRAAAADPGCLLILCVETLAACQRRRRMWINVISGLELQGRVQASGWNMQGNLHEKCDDALFCAADCKKTMCMSTNKE